LETLFARPKSSSVPNEFFSKFDNDNCLPRLRAYWDNLDGGAEPFRQHKLFLLGNGTVGKTQVARALMGAGFDDTIPSTHGIQLHTHPLPAPIDARHDDAGEAFTAKIWDFGGQDIYHGTHALFLKTRAIFLICWDAVSENAREHTLDGVDYRNRPLAYWRDYVRAFAGPQAEVILVQTKDDLPGAAAAAARIAELYPDTTRCSTSAKDGEGFTRLKRLIAEAVGRIEAPALPIIPSSQRRVIDAITAARHAGTRTLTREAFADLCRDCGLIGAPEHVLHFLHHTGEVFHAEDRFGGQIIVDQRWALDAIYTVFDRAQCWQRIKAERGRFTLSLLAETVWQDFSEADRSHLLAMMLQCGMAFAYIEGEARARETLYIAPDLLPDFADPAVQRWFLREWDPGDPGLTLTLPVPLLHDGLIRALMVEVGKDAGMWAVYWKTGVLFHDMTTRALAMIEARWPDPEGWAGKIVITTQRSRAGELLAVLERHVRKVAERLGITLGETVLPHAPDRAGISDDFARARDPRARLLERGDEPAAFTPGRGSPRVPSCYVSYAWSDGTAQADANARMVDDLCAAAAARGIAIVRDKTRLGSGDSINAFTEEIARAERVATLIGGRYWTRPDCFAELYGSWVEARQRPELFRQKVREFIFADAGLYEADIVQKVAQHWEAEFARCDAMRGTYRNRHAALIADHADSWAAQSRRIISTLLDRPRPYEGNFEAFKDELFAELENLRYRPDDGPDA
jgi:internalin A